ncbi:MAG: hypothetical protein HC906_08615 [Bacteroidales bacterium]|nr:hypothetical protein [Bacteroidales bacterium]
MIKNLKYLFKVFITIILFGGCEKVADFYIGIPFQPEFLTDDFTAGLNIFGIVRPDTSEKGVNNSFVHVQQVIRAIGDSAENIEIKNAQVTLIRKSQLQVADSFLLKMDSVLHHQRNYYPVKDLSPKAGESYELKCSSDNLPVLWAFTTIPNEPVIQQRSVHQKAIEFEIAADSTAFMYVIYLVQNNMQVFKKVILADRGKNHMVSIPENTISGSELMVFAYDTNLANYIANSNTAFNINKYKQYDDQVEGGYGVFGSLNFSKTIIE